MGVSCNITKAREYLRLGALVATSVPKAVFVRPKGVTMHMPWQKVTLRLLLIALITTWGSTGLEMPYHHMDVRCRVLVHVYIVPKGCERWNDVLVLSE